MPTEHSHQIHLNKSRELMALKDRLNQEYAELLETSLMLRKESSQLREDSHVLRRISNGLMSNANS